MEKQGFESERTAQITAILDRLMRPRNVFIAGVMAVLFVSAASFLSEKGKQGNEGIHKTNIGSTRRETAQSIKKTVDAGTDASY